MSETAKRGVIDRVISAYWDFSSSMREIVAARPSEATLLSLAMIAAFVSFSGAALELFLREGAAQGAFGDQFRGRIAAEFVGRLFFLPLGLVSFRGAGARDFARLWRNGRLV